MDGLASEEEETLDPCDIKFVELLIVSVSWSAPSLPVYCGGSEIVGSVNITTQSAVCPCVTILIVAQSSDPCQ